MAENLQITAASEQDVPVILRLVRQLAEYERMAGDVTATEASLRESLFGAQRHAEVAIGYVDGEPAGMVVFFPSYSTFLARPGIYLEDLIVEERFRGRGLGRALMQYLARIAVERGCARFEWSVLDWNQPAIGFYQSLGAKPQDTWRVYRLAGEALQRLARGEATMEGTP